MKRKLDIARPFRALVGLLFLLIIVVTCVQVVSRYVFNYSLVWSEELVRFWVIWMCMIGAAVHSCDDSHMAINSFVEKFPVGFQFALYTVRQALIVVFSAWSAVASFKLLKAASGTYSGALNISFALWRGAGTAGLFLVALYTVFRYVQDFGRFKRGEFFLGERHETKEKNR